ncbi:MAG: FixH family protein [Methylovirgula sp.]
MPQNLPQRMAAATGAPIEAGENGGRPLTGAKFLAILVAFFGTIFLVNGAMVYYALSTFSGVVDPHPYEHGLAYNKDIAAAEAQDARHWQVAAHISGAAVGAKTVEAVFLDRDNQALTGLAVTAKLEFATDMMRDRSLALTEVAAGVYRGAIAVASGQWDLVIEAKRDAKQVFRSRNRVTIP